VALDERQFVSLTEPSRALTSQSAQAEGDIQVITTEVEGLVMLTQSCDIVRPCVERPFVEVAPLISLSTEYVLQVKKMMRPQYAFVPATEHPKLVAHLDTVMTVEKSVVASWKRTQGCRTDEEIRRFNFALARKRSRFAFPDDFHDLVSRLEDRIEEKHEKQSDEGNALRSLFEIRVSASPSWNDAAVEISFHFIRNENEPYFQGQSWDQLLDKWLALVQPQGRFKTVGGIVTTLDYMTAKDFTESELLDLDHLSG
jgi:hypothetical protein